MPALALGLRQLGVLAGLSLPVLLVGPSAAFAVGLGCQDRKGSYVNVSGHKIHDPECVSDNPARETAICRDGAHSFSEHRQGTCSGHGGVAQWE